MMNKETHQIWRHFLYLSFIISEGSFARL